MPTTTETLWSVDYGTGNGQCLVINSARAGGDNAGLRADVETGSHTQISSLGCADCFDFLNKRYDYR